HNHKGTISSLTIQNAVRLTLLGELQKHAISEATKAVTKYTSSMVGGSFDEQEGGKGKIYRSSRAGLTFPVSRVEHLIRENIIDCKRVSSGAPVYLAAILEYLT